VKRGLLSAVVAIVLAGPSACDGIAPLLPADAAFSYRVEWSWEGAEWDDAEGAWVFETDLGVRVGLRGLWVSSLSIELVPCAPEATAWYGPSVAWADHGYTHDSTLLEGAFVESGAPLDVGAVKASGSAYCQAHVLAGPSAAFAADGVAMQGDAVVFDGWLEVKGSPRREVEARLALAAGSLLALDGSPGARVVIERRPARALDGVDVAGLGDEELAYELLRGFQATSVARWEGTGE